MSFHDRGRADGESLAELASGIAAVESEVRRAFHELTEQVQTGRKIVERELAAAREREAAHREREEVWRKRTEDLVERREQSPGGFSLVKGTLYIVFSIALLFGDMVLLMEVASIYFALDVILDDGTTYMDLLFSGDFLRLLQSFGGLVGLTIAVLLCGMFLKIWRDIGHPDPQIAKRRERILFSMLLVLALLGVVGMSVARLQVNPAAAQSTGLSLLAQVVSAVLGLALPLVSAGFFIKGYDAWESRYQMFRAHCAQGWHGLRAWLVANKVAQQQGRIDRLESVHGPSTSLAALDAQLVQARVDYQRGYYEGVRALMAGGGLLDRLKPVAIARVAGARP